MTVNQVTILVSLLALVGSVLSLFESRAARKATRSFEKSNLLLDDLRKAHEKLNEKPELTLDGKDAVVEAFSAKQELCHYVVDQYAHLLPVGDRDEVRSLRKRIDETMAFHRGSRMGLRPDESKFDLIPRDEYVATASLYVKTVESAFGRELDRVTDQARRDIA